MLTVLNYTGYRHDRGGIVTVIRALAGANKFRVVHGVSPNFAAEAEPLLDIWTGPDIEGEQISVRNFFRARVVAREVSDWLSAAPDRLVHVHSRAGLLVAWWLERWREHRVIVSIHCYGRQRWFYRRLAHRFGSRCFWLTPAMREYYGVAGAGWDQCLPGGVLDDFDSIMPSKPIAGRLRLGGAGMLVRWKRWDLVLHAIAQLSPGARVQVSFEHIGAPTNDGESRAYAAELCGLAGKLGVADRVRWCGQERSPHRLVASVDLVVVPSHQEPYSMILQEAWAAGIAVIVADSGGPRDVMRPGENGWLFRDGDASSLAEVLERVVQDRTWTKLDPQVIRRSARRAANVAEQWAAIYRQHMTPTSGS